MFDLGMLQGAAKRKAGKMMPTPGKTEVEVTVEADDDGAGDVAAELAACAKKYGVPPEQMLADFKEFEAQKYGGGGKEEPMEPPVAEEA